MGVQRGRRHALVGEERDERVEVRELAPAGQEEGVAERDAGEQRGEERKGGRHAQAQAGGALHERGREHATSSVMESVAILLHEHPGSTHAGPGGKVG